MQQNACKLVSAYAPGRVELLGNHTDYNEGLVLGAAIDRGLRLTGEARIDHIISISSTLMGRAEIPLSDLRPGVGPGWTNYPLGVVQELINLGIPIQGFTATVEGDLPPRSGLSSSAALEVATALFLLKVHGRELDKMKLAKLCQRAEHGFAGVQSGLLDQVMSIFGRKNQVIFFDTRSEEVRLIGFPEDLALIIAETGKQRELSSGEYNLRREETRAAATSVGVRALRDVSLDDLNRPTDLDPLLKRRAAHIVGENDRVRRAIGFLGRHDPKAFGQLLNESHQSSRENFDNSTPELDLLVDLAREIPGVLGARLTGAGFGGAIVALCRKSHAQAAAQQLRQRYRQKTGIHAEMFVCQIGDGAH